MSWMRRPMYVWGDGTHVHLWVRRNAEDEGVYASGPSDDPEGYPDFAAGVAMPMKLWDELVVLRFAELATREQKDLKRAVKRLKKKGSGNFGTWTLMEVMGENPSEAFHKMMTDAQAKRDAAGRYGESE